MRSRDVALAFCIFMVVAIFILLAFRLTADNDYMPHQNGVTECMNQGTPPNPNQFTPEQVDALNEVRLAMCQDIQGE